MRAIAPADRSGRGCATIFWMTINFRTSLLTSKWSCCFGIIAEKLPMHVKAGFPKTHGNEICVTRNHLLCYIFSSLVCFSIWNLLSESTPAASPFVVYRCYSSSNPVADIGNFNFGDAINFRALWINAQCVIPKFIKQGVTRFFGT